MFIWKEDRDKKIKACSVSVYLFFYGWEIDTLSLYELLSTLVFEAVSLKEPGACFWNSPNWAGHHRKPPVSEFPALGFQVCHTGWVLTSILGVRTPAFMIVSQVQYRLTYLLYSSHNVGINTFNDYHLYCNKYSDLMGDMQCMKELLFTI